MTAARARLGDQDKEEAKRDKLEEKADKLERKLDAIQRKVEKAEAKADALEKKQDGLEKKLDKLEAKLDKLEKKKDAKKGDKKKRPLRNLRARLTARREEISTAISILGEATRPAAAGFVLSRRLLGRGSILTRSPAEKEKILDGDEADLDKGEKAADKDEKDLDQLEKNLEKLEEIWDKLEKELDQQEKDADEDEKDLDGEKPKKKARRRVLPLSAQRGPLAPPQPRAPGFWASGPQIRFLIQQMQHGGSRARRAAGRLEQLGPTATAALCRAYDTPHEHLRWEVVNLLGYTKDPRAISLLARRGIHDPEVHPRWRSIWALSSVDDGRVPGLLRAQIARSTGRRRRNAAVALSLYQDPAALPVLREGLEDRDPWIRWESASCLAGYADPIAAREVVRLYRREGDPSVRREMVRALAGASRPFVTGFLTHRLAETDPGIRLAAVHVLVSSLSRRAESILRGQLARERNSAVRRAIREGLAG